MTGYAGGERYRDERAVIDGDLITAGPQSPLQFARATLERLGLADERTLEACEALFDRGELDAFPGAHAGADGGLSDPREKGRTMKLRTTTQVSVDCKSRSIE
jgi:hypothetical protein